MGAATMILFLAALARPRQGEVDPLSRHRCTRRAFTIFVIASCCWATSASSPPRSGANSPRAADRRTATTSRTVVARVLTVDLFRVLPADAVVHGMRQGEARTGTGDLVMKKILAHPVCWRWFRSRPWPRRADCALDRAPDRPERQARRCSAAPRIFVNHCLNCHGAHVHALQPAARTSASPRRRSSDNLMFTTDKVGDTDDGRRWTPKTPRRAFGVAPPDLSVDRRARAAPDWLYTYLRGFYRDPKPADRLEQPRVPQRRHAARARGSCQGEQRAAEVRTTKMPRQSTRRSMRVTEAKSSCSSRASRRHADAASSTTAASPTW